MSKAEETFGWLVRVTGTQPEKRYVVRAEDEQWAVGFVQNHADMNGVSQLEAGRFDGTELDGLAVGEVRESAMTTPKRPRDPNQLAKFIVDVATGDAEVTRQLEDEKTTSPAIEFARSGGLKGGRARADKLSASERSDIARRAAAARWQKDDG